MQTILDFFRSPADVVLRIILIVIITLVVLEIVRRVQHRLEKRIKSPGRNQQQIGRQQTLLTTGVYLVRIVVVVVALLMILDALGINITPILASIGVAGLAISLGAQTLIKDYVGGLFILAENQYAVGDYVTLGDVTGTVEEITLRKTLLRDLDGKLVHVPNGEVRVIINNSYDWARAVVDLTIAYEEQVAEAEKVLQAKMESVSQEEFLKESLLEVPQVSGWNAFNDLGVQVRILAKVKADKRIEASSLLRREALQALKEANIPVAVRKFGTS
jgi:moderate conductance mechanosensitive channel